MTSSARASSACGIDDAERLRGLQVDAQAELGRPLDRQVAGARALQDLVHLDGGAPHQVVEVGAVADQEPSPRFLRRLADRAAAGRASRARRPAQPMRIHRDRERRPARGCAARARTRRRGRRRRALDDLGCKPSRRAPAWSRARRRRASTTSIGSMRTATRSQRRHRLLEQLEALRAELGKGEGQAGDVAAGPGEALAPSLRGPDRCPTGSGSGSSPSPCAPPRAPAGRRRGSASTLRPTSSAAIAASRSGTGRRPSAAR